MRAPPRMSARAVILAAGLATSPGPAFCAWTPKRCGGPPVVAASVASGAALAGIVQTPGVSQFFGCQLLGPLGWGIGLGAAAAALGAPVVTRIVDPLLDRNTVIIG